MENMYAPNNRYKKIDSEIHDIIVEWEQGMVKGFRSKEEAERFINHVCKKTAPDIEYSVSFCLNK
ncbi:MAG: hypothetical protein J5U17_03755 [Candidatus Methanoperedens sp.]|nr:hypothetical protein [Candidatus Methanoperedens sp.]MCE8424876.1 hypothetical protein [Candidatus Methanoperedens sp.]MCE8427194.1 hypothetical protein [Candidatus Methanoperedens sp.]